MTNITLQMRPEKRFIRTSGSSLHIDFYTHVDSTPAKIQNDRTPLTLALVLDRSGSMQGEKIITAKKAALAVLDRLNERDSAAIVVFDDRIDIIQSLAPVTASFKTSVQKALSGIEARANTALHEGWLTGCKAIASDKAPSQSQNLSRCFLLTDGIANVGITDPEQIASEAAGIREHTGIGTSTFGIGTDYNESLLGPMAVAGGGQFHNLRTAAEITRTFIGELGNLQTVAVSQVRLEIQVAEGITTDLISSYWNRTAQTQSIMIGDLQGGEERHIVTQFSFPKQEKQDGQSVRARLLWVSEGKECQTDWQESWFSYASDQICDAEQQDPNVMHWVGLHTSDRAQREAIKLSQQGDLPGAQEKLRVAMAATAPYADKDEEVRATVVELDSLARQMANQPLPAPAAKEIYYQKQNRSRGQKDLRE